MMEIYERHADRYDELVRAEDHRNNLQKALQSAANWDGASVCEAGVGTGRVTRIYADAASEAMCMDGSRHMVEFAKRSLSHVSIPLTFRVADNLSIPRLESPVDIFVEGWSFGHSVVEAADQQTVASTTAELVKNAARNVRPGGRIIILETLGTNVQSPAPPTSTLAWFYDELERAHGFGRLEISTDYRFPSNEEAARIMGFFFGDDMAKAVRARGGCEIPEWTGMWVLTA